MYRMSVLYGLPTDPAAFERYYWDQHLEIASRRQGIRRWTVTKLEASPQGDPSPYFYLADMYADSRASLIETMRSEAGQLSRRDVANFATGGVTFLYGEDQLILDRNPPSDPDRQEARRG